VGLEPSIGDVLERSGVEVVKFETALAFGLNQARGFQQLKVLRDRLARGAELMFGSQP
jgi:hypothetical protein